MTPKTLLIACFAVASLHASTAYDGPTFVVDAWKGETVYAPIPDRVVAETACLHGAKGDGVSLALGSLKRVPYQSTIGGSFFAERLDLFELSEDGDLSELGDKAICRVAVAADARPGWHEFGPLKLRVLDRVLPPAAERKYFLDLWQHPWAVSRFFGVKPFSRKHYAKMEPVWRTLAEAGQKALTVTLLDLPWNHQCYDGYPSMIGRVKKDDGTWVFDYMLFDEYVAFGRKCGIGPDIACYTMCPWGFVVRWKNEKGEVQSLKALPGTPEFEEYWGDFLVDFAKHLKAKGWFADAYIAMDERAPDDVAKIAAFIQKKAPGMKIAMAGNRKPSDFKGIAIDNYSQVLSDVTPEFLNELNDRRAKGWKTTFYVCCSPMRPNTFMQSPDGEGYWIGAYPALSGFDGFLRWAANSWPRDPYENAAYGTWTAGDTFLVYPNGEPSARFLALRAGIIASEKLRILRAQGLFEKEVAALAEKYDFKKALGGKINMDAFRRDLEALVNK